MAHDGSVHGQPSPPSSIQEGYLSSEYAPSPVPGIKRPYTPPTSHPSHPFSYADPADYEMRHQQEYFDDSVLYRATPYRTPPQQISGSGIQTRSGRSLGTPGASSSPSSRMSSSPRPRRNRRGKDRQLEYKISEPLSVMTKDYDVPIENMEDWVNRSSEHRWDEVRTKHKNKIPRPMNSFMLYRRAYKERIKKWGAQGDNNQLISSVAGFSWNIEPPHIKDYYSRVAILERDNHTAAFPDYKFAPNKNTKKRERDDDDSDGEWDGDSSYSSKRRRGRHDRDLTRSRSTTPAQVVYGSPFHPSSYQASNPHLIPVMNQYDQQWLQPMQYGSGYPYDHFPYHRQPHAMQYTTSSMPTQSEQYSLQLVGLPPTVDTGLEADSMDRPEFAVDPALGSFPASYEYGSFTERAGRHDGGRAQIVYEDEAEAVIHPGLQTLTTAEPIWSPTGSGHAGGAFDAEFSRWNGET